MNCFTECNSLNIGARSKAWASATEKQELERAPSIEGKSSKGSGPQEFFKLIETSPMVVSAPAAKAVAKRKKRQNWCKVVSTTAERRSRCNNEHLETELVIKQVNSLKFVRSILSEILCFPGRCEGG